MVLGADSAYVIHLTRQEKRKKRMDHLIQKLQLTNINYIDAIDKNDHLEDSFEFSKKYFDTTFWDPNGWCTLGILCCALSHRKAWKAFLDSGDEVGLFLEDDIRSTPFFSKLNFKEIREELDDLSFNNNWGVAILGRYQNEIIHGKQITNNFYRSVIHNDQYSGHAYLLNKRSAKWFYDNTEKIKYAADLRLEISPFKVITLKESVLVQRYHDYDSHKSKILDNPDKYQWVFEFLHETTNECFTNGTPGSWKENGMLISNHVPVETISYSRKNIRGTTIRGCNMVIGDKNNIGDNFIMK